MAGKIDHSAEKRFFDGTHRVVDPTQTLTRVQPALRSCGITRVAVLTGLDVIGIPVVAAYRPNSRSIAVHQGKGSTLAAAKASAVMEAIETAHAETTSLDLRLAAHAELAATAEVADPATLPRAHGRVAGHERLLWVAGKDLFSGRPLWVPHELVSADFCVPLAPGAGLFQATTNGLASGNHPDEAIVHALTEVIERDAIALWRAASDAAQDRRALDPGSVDGPAAQAMLARFAAAGVAVQIWDITGDIGLPVFLCLCSSRALGDGVEPEFGAGCHTDRDVALARALAEAAQARLTVISGAREDVGADGFRPAVRDRRERAAAEFLRAPAQRDFARVPTWSTRSVTADVAAILGRLEVAGIRQAAHVDLTRADWGIPVARLVVPGLEGPWTPADGEYTPGARARAVGA